MNSYIKTLFPLFPFVFCFLTNLPAKAAERIYFNYGLLGFSVSVNSLATFAEEGKIDKELAFYLKRLQPQQRSQFRDFLRSRYKVNSLTVYRFSRTSVGEKLLNKIGDFIQIPGGRNGFYGVRGAVVQSASDPQGINVITLLRNFPTDIQLNTSEIIKLVKQFSHLDRESKNFIDSLAQIPQENGNSQEIKNLEKLPNLAQSGSFNIEQQTIEFLDQIRQRKLIVDFYLPQGVKQAPLIFISNGINANRNRFKYLAEYLASNGFAIAIPDHPGSNERRHQAFLSGLYSENFDAQEFINRPLDITYLLDRIEQINQSRFNNQLNLQQVGIFGYSFGGTTALALAGAKIDFQQLEKDCNSQVNPINISILYQCRILELPRETINTINLEDKRIKAAFVFVPFGKSIFGKTGMSRITIPIFWQAADQDLITPLLLEQIPSFSWLTNQEKYLVISQKLPHALITLGSTTDSNDLTKVREIIKTYLNTLSLVFFKVHVAQEEQYRPYLQASYLRHISQKPYTLNLIREIKRIEE